MRLAWSTCLLLLGLGISPAAFAALAPLSHVPRAVHDAAMSTGFVVVSQDESREVALGTGVCVQPDYVITNRHVVEHVLNMAVRQGRRRWMAIPVRINPEWNLAILHVPGLEARPAEVRASRTLQAGESVFGLVPGAGEMQVSLGQLSGLQVFEKQTVLEVTVAAAIRDGGGPLFDRQGNVIGLTAFHLRDQPEVALAIPGEALRAALHDLRPAYERRTSALTPGPPLSPPSGPAVVRPQEAPPAPPPLAAPAAPQPQVAARPATSPAPAISSSPPVAAAPAEGSPVPEDPPALHRWSLDAYVAGDFSSAIAGFTALRARGLSREEDARALYWLAENHYHARQYQPAQQALQQLIAQYPDLSRLAGAYLRLGETCTRLRQPARARDAFCAVVRQFPQSAEAAIVREREVPCE